MVTPSYYKSIFIAVYDFDSEDDGTPLIYDEKRQLSLDINRVSILYILGLFNNFNP